MRLLIDSSGPQLVCALAEEGSERIVAEVTLGEADRNQPIDSVLESLLGHCTVADIYSIVVGTGPGSFIGTRTAISFANGFAAAANVELFGVNSLSAIAAGTGELPPPAVLRDARRGQWFLWLSDDDCHARDEAGVIEALSAQPPGAVVLDWSDGSEPELNTRLREAQIGVRLVSGVTGEGLLRADRGEPRSYVEPIYLRGFT